MAVGALVHSGDAADTPSLGDAPQPRLLLQDRATLLRSKMARWLTQPFDHEGVVYVVKTIARELLPKAGVPASKWRRLNTFANWCLHHELTRVQLGADALLAIAEAVPVHHAEDPAHDNDWLAGVVNRDLSFAELRLELLAACRRFDLPSDFLMTWEGWQRFAIPLAHEIAGRPVSVDNAEVRQRVHAATEALGVTLQSIMLVSVANLPFQYGWCIGTSGPQIIVPVWFGEREMTPPIPPGWVPPF